MPEITYEAVEHNGGFAYRVGDVFSETFATHQGAHEAAQQAAERQRLAGDTEIIQYQDASGTWHEEVTSGEERPETSVEDELAETLEARDENGEVLDERDVPSPDRTPIKLDHREN